MRNKQAIREGSKSFDKKIQYLSGCV